jgi:hypothetical protein
LTDEEMDVDIAGSIAFLFARPVLEEKVQRLLAEPSDFSINPKGLLLSRRSFY